MATAQGFPVLEPGSDMLHTWVIPGAHRKLTVLRGSVGFLIVFFASFWNDIIERLDAPGDDPVDEGGYVHRLLTGSTTVWSLHATGRAADLNWRKHPYNTYPRETFTKLQRQKIRRKIRRWNTLMLTTVIEWGGNWPSHPASTAKPDPMHIQIVCSVKRAERLARLLMRTPRGKRVLKANPGQKAVILS